MNKKLPLLKNKKSPFGFTLIELLIVITIIGILAAIGLVTYTNALKSTRDGRRKADITSIQKALELYFQQNSNKYPTDLSSLGSLLPAGVPTDPKTQASYCYVNEGSACGTAKTTDTDYKLCAISTSFEVSPTPSQDFCVTRQQ